MIKNLLSKRIIKSSLLGIIMAVVFAVSFALASIPLGSNFQLNSQLPLDARTVVADITARDAIPSGQRYRGLTVYVLSDSTNYQLQAGITNGDWIALADAGGSMIYPGAGIAVSNGSSWGASITNNSANWNTAFGWGDHSIVGYVTGTPWTGMGYITDGNTGWDNSYGFITSLNGAVLTDQTTPQTVGNTTDRLSKLWVTDIDVEGSVVLATTVDATSGVIYKGVDPFIHNFALPGTTGLNTFVGINAGNFTMTGSTGDQGSYNTGIGTNTLFSNTTGNLNTAIGSNSLRYNTTGSVNTGLGQRALARNTTGNGNTASGYASLSYNTTGIGNTANGYAALTYNIEGNYNTGIGYEANNLNLTGDYNVGNGYRALINNTVGSYNTASGVMALNDLGESVMAGSFQIGTSYIIEFLFDTDFTAIGAASNTVGEVFTATGPGTGIGSASRNINTDNNTALGYNTGRGIITGSNNTILGANVVGLPSDLSNTVILADGTGAIFAHNFALPGTDGFNTFVGPNSGNFTMTGSTGQQGSYNVGIGSLALNSNTTGQSNVATGSGALRFNTIGSGNVAYGGVTLRNNTTGDSNTAVGFSALYSNITGNLNEAFGHYALVNNTTGSDNIGLGQSTLNNNTTGSKNIAIGNETLRTLDITTNDGSGNNTAIGTNTGLGIITGINNTILGANVTGLPADLSNTVILANGNGEMFAHNFGLPGTDGFNTFVGIGSGNLLMTGSVGTQGSYNTGIGFLSLNSNTTGESNTAVGFGVLRYNTTGSNNVGYGGAALRYNTTGNDNTAVGRGALFSNTIGSRNIANGYAALLGNITGNDNVATGLDALVKNTTGNNNVATGNRALTYNITGNNNVATGHFSLVSNVIGNNNTVAGMNSLPDLGIQQLATTLTNGTSYIITFLGTTDFTAIGAASNTVGEVFTATGPGTGDGTASFNINTDNNTAIGYGTGGGIVTGINNTILGANVTGLPADLSNTVILADGTGAIFAHNFALPGTDGFNTFVGIGSGNFTMTGSTGAQGSANTALGYAALESNTIGARNNAFGRSALRFNTTGELNNAFGFAALRNNTTGNYNTAIGDSSLYENTTGDYNVALGSLSLFRNVDGNSNVSIGSRSMEVNVSGSNNVANGMYALFTNTTGSNNTALGAGALSNLGVAQTAGDFNIGTSYTILTVGDTDFTSIGAGSNTVGEVFTATGVGVGTGTATANNINNNIAIGFNTGGGIITGINNTIIGPALGLPSDLSNTVILANGSGEIFAHNFAVPGTIGDNTFVGLNSGNLTMTGSTGVEGSKNVGFGTNALSLNTTGFANTAIGRDSLKNNTTGMANVAVGEAALFSEVDSQANTAIGREALYSNVIGDDNIAIGYRSLYNNIVDKNTAVGVSALSQTTTGGNNVALGQNSGFNLSVPLLTNTNSTFIGSQANSSIDGVDNSMALGYITQVTKSNQVVIGNTSVTETLLRGNVGINTTAPAQALDVVGSIALPTTVDATSGVIYKGVDPFIHNFALPGTDGFNTFVGINSGNFTMTGSTGGEGSENTAVGYVALESNTIGYRNTAIGRSALRFNTTGYLNTASGGAALRNNTTGTHNTAMGDSALYENISGQFNTAIGMSALHDNTAGTHNTVIGYNTGIGITTGVSNTIIGASVTGLAADLSNNIIIADGAGNRRINVNSSGNVGIGTIDPQKRLEINDNDANTTTSGFRFTDFACTGDDKLTVGAGGDIICATDQTGSGTGNIVDTLTDTLGAGNDANALDITNIGRLYTALGTEGIPAFSFQADTDTGMWSSASNILNFSTGATERVRIDAFGNVGIGTTAPGELLSLGLAGTTKGVLSLSGDVSGKIIIQPADAAGSYTLTLPTTLGSAGQVLTDIAGDGVLGWTNGGGGGAGTLADTSALSTDATKSLYTMTSTIPVEFKRSGGESLLYLDETNAKIGIGTATPEGVLHVYREQVANGSDWYGPDLILTRFWGSNTDTRAASVYNYYNSTTNNDQMVFGVTGDGGALTNPSLYENAKMVIQANGNVGIGTTAPSSMLSVHYGVDTGNTAQPTGTWASKILNFNDMDTGEGGLVVGSRWGNVETQIFSVGNMCDDCINPGFDTFFTVKGDGNVGIGTTNPAGKLDISGGQLVLDNGDYGETRGIRFRNVADTTTATGGGIFQSNGDTVYVQSGASNTLVLRDSGGNDMAAFASSSWIKLGAADSFGIRDSGDGTFFQIDSDGRMHLGYANEALNAWSGGGVAIGSNTNPGLGNLIVSNNVGIGTDTPGSTLDVKGDFRISGSSSGYVGFVSQSAAGSTTYTLPNSDGSNNYVLTTDGLGNLSWSDKTGGSPGSISSINGDSSAAQTIVAGAGLTLVDAGPSHTLALDLAYAPTWTGAHTFNNGTYVSYGVDTGGTTLPSGTWASQILNINDATGEGGLVVANRWANADTQIFSVGNMCDGCGDIGFDTFLTVKGDGNIGIGTIDPSTKIEAYGTDAGIIVHNSGNSRGGIWALSNQRLAFAQTAVADDLVFGYGDSPVTSANFVERMRVVSSTGNVGIGTTAPEEMLNVMKNDVAGTRAGIYLQGIGDSYASVKLGSLATFSEFLVSAGNADNTFGGFEIRDTNADATRFAIANTTGNVGIGTNTPGVQLEVFGTSNKLNLTYSENEWGKIVGSLYTIGSGDLYLESSHTVITSSPADIILSANGGNVGIGNTAPATALDVTGTIRQSNCTTAGTLSADTNGDIICTPSSEKFKDNISDLTVGLSDILALRPVSYTFRPEMSMGSGTRFGFISEEVSTLVPEFATHDAEGNPYGLDNGAILAASINAIKELNLNLEGIAGINTPLEDSENEFFVTTFFDNIKITISTWLADATNGIGNMFADVFNAKEKICIDGECLTKDDVRALLLLVHPDGSPSTEEEEPIEENPLPEEEPVVDEIPAENPTPVEEDPIVEEEVVIEGAPLDEAPNEEVPAEDPTPTSTEADPAPEETPTP